jgi:hypothetical protein
LCAAALAVTAQAQTTKTFEFGPGTPYSNSNIRTFPVPSGSAVSAVIKYQRLGSSDISIDVELHEPDTSPGVEGPLVEVRHLTAKATEQTVVITGLASARGCSLPWRVRVKHTGAAAMPAAVFGSARLDYDNRQKTISAETAGFIGKGASKEAKFGDPNGFNQGRLKFTGNWNHMIGPVPGPNEILLRIRVIYRTDPNNTFILGPSFTGYSTNEVRNISPKFKLDYLVDQRTLAQYSIEVKNMETDDDAFMFAPTVYFVPGC